MRTKCCTDSHLSLHASCPSQSVPTTSVCISMRSDHTSTVPTEKMPIPHPHIIHQLLHYLLRILDHFRQSDIKTNIISNKVHFTYSNKTIDYRMVHFTVKYRKNNVIQYVLVNTAVTAPTVFQHPHYCLITATTAPVADNTTRLYRNLVTVNVGNPQVYTVIVTTQISTNNKRSGVSTTQDITPT